jgi:hypothetical protein
VVVDPSDRELFNPRAQCLNQANTFGAAEQSKRARYFQAKSGGSPAATPFVDAHVLNSLFYGQLDDCGLAGVEEVRSEWYDRGLERQDCGPSWHCDGVADVRTAIDLIGHFLGNDERRMQTEGTRKGRER